MLPGMCIRYLGNITQDLCCLHIALNTRQHETQYINSNQPRQFNNQFHVGASSTNTALLAY